MNRVPRLLLAPIVGISLLALASVALAREGSSVGVDVQGSAKVEGLEHESELQSSSSVQVENDDATEMDSEMDNEQEDGHNLGPALRALLQMGSSTASSTRGHSEDENVAEEVRATIDEHASTTKDDADEMDKVESRPGWLVFLIGTDFGNLGRLRSSIETTQNHIERLMKARDRATDATVKAEITAQINALQVSASTTAAFVADNESKFSLFGWFVRLFND